MRLSCPGCGATGSLEFFAGDAAAREAAALAARLPAEIGPLCMQYLGLFRPRKQALRWQRVVKILGELVACIEAGAVERHGRTWPAPVAVWKQALEAVLARRDSLSLPLSGHGYLFAIVCGDSDKIEAQVEREHESSIRAADDERRRALAAARQEVYAAEQRAKNLKLAPPSPEDIAAIYRKRDLEPPQ